MKTDNVFFTWVFHHPIISTFLVTLFSAFISWVALSYGDDYTTVITSFLTVCSACITIIMVLLHWEELCRSENQDLSDMEQKAIQQAKKQIKELKMDLLNQIKKDSFPIRHTFKKDLSSNIKTIFDCKRAGIRKGILKHRKSDMNIINTISLINNKEDALELQGALERVIDALAIEV